MSEFGLRKDEHITYEQSVRDTATDVALASDAISTAGTPSHMIFGLAMTPILAPILGLAAWHAESVVSGLVTQADRMADGLACARENYCEADDVLCQAIKELWPETIVEPKINY